MITHIYIKKMVVPSFSKGKNQQRTIKVNTIIDFFRTCKSRLYEDLKVSILFHALLSFVTRFLCSCKYRSFV